jgi:leucyl-tRNA synthetase
MNSKEAIEKITQKLKTSDHGDFAVGYKLHDWVFSRQRYWGEPIPIIHCDKCGDVPVPEKDLPVRLPEVENFAPSGTGESPLSKIDEWVNTTCPKCGGEAKRETNTMPQWAGSCWYYLRYISPNKADRFVDEQSEKYFMPVDLYIGGAEHAVLHLLYARFWHRFLYDMGYVSTDEPFQRLKNVGLILAPDRQKMSKSRGNVINPTDLQELYGVDSLRMYEMFIGPFDQSALWSTNGISGTKKFVDKVVDSFSTRSTVSVNRSNTELDLLTNSIADRIDKMHFNTAISDFMTFVNKVKLSKLTDGQWEQFLIILSPFAPHVSEYLWQKLHPKNDSSIFESSWPKKIETKADLITYVLQVNAKKRSSIDVKNGTTKDEIIKLAMADEKLQNQIGSNEIKKTIFIDGKLINFLV